MDTSTYEFYPPRLVGQRRRVCLDELCGRHGVLYVAREELGMDISEDVAVRAMSRIKEAFSRENRQSPYSPSELRELIMQIQGTDVNGINGNRKDISERLS
jgi:isopropylmalate/homocitrate/citramalate synthase